MPKTNNRKSDHLYLRIADTFEQQIMDEVLKIGDKLPSVRLLSKEHGSSVSTILQAYYHLARFEFVLDWHTPPRERWS